MSHWSRLPFTVYRQTSDDQSWKSAHRSVGVFQSSTSVPGRRRDTPRPRPEWSSCLPLGFCSTCLPSCLLRRHPPGPCSEPTWCDQGQATLRSVSLKMCAKRPKRERRKCHPTASTATLQLWTGRTRLFLTRAPGPGQQCRVQASVEREVLEITSSFPRSLISRFYFLCWVLR